MDDPFADGVTGGAAGIGIARARSMRDGGGYAAALAEGQSPYPAFAGPRRNIMKCTTEVVECRHHQEDLGAQSMIC
jgi:hypothetical protein